MEHAGFPHRLGCDRRGAGISDRALMKQRNKTFRRVIGTIVLAGWVTPEIVCALCLYSFFGDEGTLNAIITFGFSEVTWLFTVPMLTIILANIWHGTAFSMLVFQARWMMCLTK